MSQLSRPYKLALGALVVLLLAWFTVLKPSASADEVAPVPDATPTAARTLPGARGLTAAVGKAKGAVSTSRQSAAEHEAAAAGASSPDAAAAASGEAAPATGAAAAPPAGATGPTGSGGGLPGDPSTAILREARAGRVAVLLFYAPGASDDRAVRRALRDVDRHGGRVRLHAVPISRVARYAAITAGVDVVQAPTLLVIGQDHLAREIVGYTDAEAIDQLVADVGGRALTRHAGRR